MPKDYPKWMYHKTKEAKIVDSKEKHLALGKEWKESPAELEEKKSKPQKENEAQK